jgi:hypothetical protein
LAKEIISYAKQEINSNTLSAQSEFSDAIGLAIGLLDEASQSLLNDAPSGNLDGDDLNDNYPLSSYS